MSDAAIAFPTPQPAPETKHERFLRIAPGRVQRAIEALKLVGDLAGPKYEYTEDEAFKAVFALRAHLEEVEKRLSREKPKKYVFSFD